MLLKAGYWFDIGFGSFVAFLRPLRLIRISSLKTCGYALGSLPQARWRRRHRLGCLPLLRLLRIVRPPHSRRPAFPSCCCWSLRVLTWLCFYAYLVTQQPSAFLRFKVFTQPLRSFVGDSTSSFRLSFGFKVFVRIRFGWDSAILLALSSSLRFGFFGLVVLSASPFLLPIFWGFFPLGAFAIERGFRLGFRPAAFTASCLFPYLGFLNLFTGSHFVRSFWFVGLFHPTGTCRILSFRVLPVCRAVSPSLVLFCFFVVAVPLWFSFRICRGFPRLWPYGLRPFRSCRLRTPCWLPNWFPFRNSARLGALLPT